MGEQQATDQAASTDAMATRPKRLAGLWLICVLLGLTAMLEISGAILGTPLGVAVFGGLAALKIGIAVGLWLRLDRVRLGAVGLLSVGGVSC